MADNKPKKKKKKVGRPKKRGRKPLKKKSTKSKVLSPNSSKKGFGSALTYNKVRKLIWENHKEDFASYKDFISSKIDENGNKIKGSSITSLVYAECKSQDCLDSDVLNIYVQLNQTKGEAPQLPAEYYEEHHYWELLTENWWVGFSNDLWVSAPMLLNNPDSFLGVNGEDRYVDDEGDEVDRKDYDNFLNKKDSAKQIRFIEGYKKRFQPFVDFCNLVQLQNPDYDNYVAWWKFYGTEENPNEPYWNSNKNRWEIQIVICTEQGLIDDYGFNPEDSGGDIDISKLPQTTEKPIEITEQQKKDIDNADIEIKKIEAERSLLEQKEKTAKAETEKMQTQLTLIKEYKELGLTNEQIKKLLGL